MEIIKKMLRIIVMVALLTLDSLAFSQTLSQEYGLNKSISNAIGNKNVVNILSKRAKVLEFSIAPSEKKDLALPMDMYWIRRGEGRQLGADEVAKLYFLVVNNPRNYSSSFAYISNPYIPEVEYSVMDEEGDSVEIRLSPSDKTWTILYKGESVFHNRFVGDNIVAEFTH